MHAPDVKNPIPNPGLNGDPIIYDDGSKVGGQKLGSSATVGLPSSEERRVIVDLIGDQIVTVFHEISFDDGATWHIVNGSGDASSANVLLDKDYYLRAGRNRIRVHSTTAPGAGWQGGVRIIYDRAAAV
jgi:hypothetical protein